MDGCPTPIVLKKGGQFCETLSSPSSTERTVCPREKFAGCVNEDRSILLQLISDDSQSFVIKDTTFVTYEWVVPVRAQQDCVLDQNRDGNSELLALTSSMECRWYIISERSGVGGAPVAPNDSPKGTKKEENQDDGACSIKVDFMATLKKADLCNKLRKMDFPDTLSRMDMLGSEDGQAIVLFNSCLVCRFSLDVDFGSVALVGCYLLQLSLHHYQDEQLPATPASLSCCTFVSPLLFAMTTDGIVFVYRASNGGSIGILSVMQYCYYHCGQSCDLLSDVTSSSFRMLCVSHDLKSIAIPTPCNHVLLINTPDYFQTFPYHYHPDFITRTAKLYDASSSPSLAASRVDISREEEEERQRYGGLLPHSNVLKYRGSFPGSYSWMCQLDNLNEVVKTFDMDKNSSVSLQQSSELPQKCGSHEAKTTSDLEALPLTRMWYEAPQVSTSSRDAVPTSVPVVTGIQVKFDSGENGMLDALRPSTRYYQTHCVLPAASSGESQVVHVDFTSRLVVVHYGQGQGKSAEITTDPLRFPVHEMTLYHTDSHCYYSSRLPEPSLLLHTVLPDALVYFVNEHSFFIVTYNLSQEEFVGKMLMFGSANVAEEVCHLNRWDKCSLPINALETALELRQLDTLAFFLRSRDIEQDQDSDMPTLPPLPPDQLDTVVQLLIDAIQRNCQEEHHYQFAGQLLIMTLEFVIRMIKTEVMREGCSEFGHTSPDTEVMLEGCLESGHTSPDGQAEDGATHSYVSVADLTSHVRQLRSFLPKATVMMHRDHLGRDLEEGEGPGSLEDDNDEDHVTNFLSPALVADWNKLGPKEVIRDALLRNCLPLAQSYLMQRKPEDCLQPRMGSRSYGFEMATQRGVSIAEAMESFQQGQKHISASHTFRFDASLRSMQVTGVGYVMEALQKRNIRLAKSILCHLGMDVQSSIKHICFHTLDRDLRDYLCTMVELSESETAALEYVHILERYYPLQSYDQAFELHSKDASSSKMTFQCTALPVLPGIMSRTTAIPSLGNLQDLYPENFGGDHNLVWDATVLSPLSQPSGLYIQAPLAVVLTWDAATKQRLFFENFMMQKQADGSDCEQLVKKQHIFDYYISHNDQASALQFIMTRVPSLEDPTLCPPYVISLLSTLPHATEHVRNVILDELARNGIFILSELEAFPALLHRLGRVHSLFTLPHPLIKTADNVTQYKDEHYTDSITGDLISMEGFHKMFLNYCIEQRFFSLMSHYLDLYGLGLNDSSIAMLGLDRSDQSWVSVLLNYRRAELNPSDPNVIFRASLSCGKMLLSLDPKPPPATVMGMLQSGRTLMALSTLMFAPSPLELAMSEFSRGESWYAEAATLRQAIAAYTSLQAAIFPPAPTTLTPAQSQDITVYELLQDCVPFDIAHLFKWQSTNTVASRREDQTSFMTELPHFSSTALADKFAVSEHLDYVYYLRRGQPSFAFANFVATKLVGRSNTAKRINRLMSRVYWLAMHDLTNSHLAASCAALLEMLGKDSTCLRVDLQSASRIVKYETYYNKDGKMSQGRENGYTSLVSRFCQLQKSSDSVIATSLLVQLEASTTTMITSEFCGLEAEECWQLVQSFCICHHLPPSLAFITVCADHGQWLPLLCHAQLYNIPSQKVLKIVERSLNNSSVREHLTLAISSIDTSNTPLSPFMKGAENSEGSKSRRRRLSSGVRNSQSEKAQKLVTTQTNLRAKFYSRVGLQREVTPQPEPRDEGEKAEKEDPQVLSGGSTLDTGESSPPVPPKIFPPALVEDELPSDLFSAIFKSDSHQCSWRALLAHAIALHRPLLAILAACYEESLPVECVCAWMFSTLKPSMFEKLTILLTVNGEIAVQDDKLAYCAEIQWREWSTLDLSLMLISAMQHSPNPAAQFSLAFKYFDENSPLLSFLRFHEEFVLRSDYEECKKHLQEFRLSLDKCREYSFSGVIGDLCWVEQVASSMASHMLVTCPTSFERSHLLRLLSEAHFGEDFKCSVLNFTDLHLMTHALNEAGFDSGVAFTVKEHFSTVPGVKSLNEIYSVRVRVDTDYVLGLLLEKGQFEIAKQYAFIVKSTASQITVKEAEYNLKQLRKSSYWDYKKARLNFWHQCNSSFVTARVDPDSAAEFFQSVIDNAEQGSSSVTATEKALILALILKWMNESEGFKMEQTREYEKKIWLSHIHSAIEQEEEKEATSQSKFSGSPLSFLLEADTPTSSLLGHSSLLSFLSISSQPEFKGRRHLTEFMLPDNVTVTLDRSRKSALNEKEAEVFEVMLGRLMNAGMLSQARELAALFEHDSADLILVLCCIQLSQMKLTPAELTEDVLSLMSTRQPRHFTDSCTSLLEDPTHSWETAEYVRMMTMLSDRVLHARQCCDCVITCFRISLALNVSYASIISTDAFETITKLLSSKTTDKYALSSKLITTCNLTSEEVAKYLSTCISSSLQAQHSGSGTGDSTDSRSCIFPTKMSSSQFQEVIQLVNDPALLGNKLLHMAKARAAEKEHTFEDLCIQVELLIRAHDCYTMGCSVDGISQVLVVARNWVQQLEKGKHYQLLVRLLTGISRYHEMSYIIGLLIEHDQFENLVHAGIDKEEQLRVALIEYLHKHGKDSDKLMMVAMNFNMLREQAKTTEDRAKKDLASIKRSHLVSNNMETVKKLKRIFDDFRLAARMYAQENCLYHSERCLSQARLVALQLSVTTSKQVINLDAKAVMKYMEEQPFTEALILSDAYRQSVWTDWINPLYKRVVVAGDVRYLREYERAFTMTPTVYTELASKFQRDKERSQDTVNNMRMLLADLKNLILKQKLATQLGFQDLFPARYDRGYMSDLQRL